MHGADALMHAQLRRMLDMIHRIRQTIARSVPVTKALADECEQRQRCWRGFSRKSALQAGSLEAATMNGDAGKQIAVDISVPFLHAFVIPNYKVRLHCHRTGLVSEDRSRLVRICM